MFKLKPRVTGRHIAIATPQPSALAPLRSRFGVKPRCVLPLWAIQCRADLENTGVSWSTVPAGPGTR